MNAITITKTRDESKLILKNMPKVVQATCDKIWVAGADFAGATMTANERDSALRLALLDASNAFEAVKKDSGYKGFGAFACDVFGFGSDSAVTNAVKVAEQIDLPKVPKLSAWYSTFMLYELRGVPSERLKADVESGALHAGMTMQDLREYRKSCELEFGEDKAKVVPTFDAHFAVNGVSKGAADLTFDEVKEHMRSLIETDAKIEDDRFASYNPHAERDIDAKTSVKGKGLVLVFGVTCVTCVYFPLKRSKVSKANADTIAAQNATIEKLMAEIAALKAQQ